MECRRCLPRLHFLGRPMSYGIRQAAFLRQKCPFRVAIVPHSKCVTGTSVCRLRYFHNAKQPLLGAKQVLFGAMSDFVYCTQRMVCRITSSASMCCCCTSKTNERKGRMSCGSFFRQFSGLSHANIRQANLANPHYKTILCSLYFYVIKQIYLKFFIFTRENSIFFCLMSYVQLAHHAHILRLLPGLSAQ